MKRLALFLDGTWNDVSSNTNVWRMKALCAPIDNKGIEQRLYYDEGVAGVRGGGFGQGLGKNILQAYQWVVENFEKDDEIFIFGFSRGGFTARSLAGFISKYGVLSAGSPLGIGQLYQRYQQDDKPTLYALDGLAAKGSVSLSLEDRWIRQFCLHTHIKMVGVWDTVGALGIPIGSFEGISTKTFNWMHTGLREPIQNAYHAVAVDELRKKFAPTLWTIKNRTDNKRTMANVEQRWFPGAHANVGGGYFSDPLAQRPLRWMMNKAENLGLEFRSIPDQLNDVHEADIAESHREFLSGIYRLISPPFARRIGEGQVKVEGLESQNLYETIDRSVFERMQNNHGYRPKNIVEWAKRHSFNWQNSGASVDADTARPIACLF
ncbi:DUF2235 domain-containing protein [Brucella pseudogrignonensis]|uniref:DUF2235 domain-containing protein n=1 Tax=Brucella pseudogrignonensis TaxID=419475 RepID=UPI000CFDC314|nr:DUF2235 domain-containing protein [Brucella pseudogrignonensis]MQP40971.1 DUF2235 domain-containing protein [Ochrobactrum sp. MYb237]PQZ40924.1 hypothetical protein CQ059_16885 [Brucella pseudogrignonensis]PRA40357.1 hypothetical protein CQ063_12270 [Brucella pseudogrignonensis]PRA68950.1 hypothetical protein CQ055_12155 [Brucella pseudogrignonensis]